MRWPIPSQPRLPFPFKVILSYLFIIALLFLPTFIYLGTRTEAKLYAAWSEQLRPQLLQLCGQAKEMQNNRNQWDVIFRQSKGLFNVWAADGRTLIYSTDKGRAPSLLTDALPEVRAALSNDAGFGVRHDFQEGARPSQLFVAQKCPVDGPGDFVLHHGTQAEALDAVILEARNFLKYAVAVALSVSVLLSFLAALFFARPLNEITQAIQNLAAGDLSYQLNVRSRDELGDASRAFADLVKELRTTFVRMGAVRASLDALLTVLPVGIVFYDSQSRPRSVNGKARLLCDLGSNDEFARAESIALSAEQAPLRQKSLDLMREVVGPLHLEWQPNALLEACWFPVFSEKGAPEPGLMIVDRAEYHEQHRLRGSIERATALLQRMAKGEIAPESRTELEHLLAQMEENKHVGKNEISARSLSDVCYVALAQLESKKQIRKIEFDLELSDPNCRVVESGECGTQALRGILEQAVMSAKKESAIQIRTQEEGRHVRLSIRVRGRLETLDELNFEAVNLGFEQSIKLLGEQTVISLAIPRA